MTWIAAALVGGSTAATSVGGDEAPEAGAACVVPAFLEDDDATSLAVYDGLRRGLEEAHLPRVCLRPVPGGDAARFDVAAREASAADAPFVVVVGRAYAARVAAAPFLRRDGRGRIPIVYVDVAWSARGITIPALSDPAPPAAVVRAEVPLDALPPLLARLRPHAPTPNVVLGWTIAAGEAVAWRRAAFGLGLASRLLGEPSAGTAFLLDAPIGLGETAPPFAALLVRASEAAIPIVSLDRGRFGKGAVLVLAPDAALLGRVAADAARRLRDGEGADRAIHIPVRAAEVLLDLDAADAQGLVVPLPFVAAADRVRATPRGPTAGVRR